MLLGVVAHSSYIYITSASWLIHDTQASPLFDTIGIFQFIFRMPAFFIVSGFFCHMTLTRYGALPFLNIRLRRIGIPLITTAVVLNGIQNYILERYHGGHRDALELFLTPPYWIHGGWVNHLWFLNCLLVFFLFAALIYALLNRQIGRLAQRLGSLRWLVNSGIYVLLFPAVLLVVDFIGYRIPHVITGAAPFLDFFELTHYAVFFAFGFLLGAYPEVLEDFQNPRIWALALVPVFVVLRLIFAPDNGHGVAHLMFSYSDAYFSWYLCIICFYVFGKYFNSPSKLFAYLSDASYSIYLFHHIFVVIIGMALIPLALSIYVKFLAVMLTAGALSLAIHHFGVLRSPVLRLLFNGKTPVEADKSIKAYGSFVRPPATGPGLG